MGFMDPGNVVWFEIRTAVGQAVKDFYGALLGWDFAVDPDSSVGAVTYTRIMAPGLPFPMGAIYDNADSPEEALNVSIVSADVGADQERLEKLGRPVPGSYAWFEVGTTDAEATADFYRQAFGWRCTLDESAGGKPYHNVFTGNQWPSGGWTTWVRTSSTT
ncbi:hypothetical protein [Streptomyces noursei]|uniref:hypothetical protein n=1 Tax=Streptomyces noursei TaxID=1971 RepID=UPI001962D23B|nr:hypothetical protein [Streptomyces noursei]QRX95060.1 hypothetical protein JNO44_33380 [Streptomyces noursei]